MQDIIRTPISNPPVACNSLANKLSKMYSCVLYTFISTLCFFLKHLLMHRPQKIMCNTSSLPLDLIQQNEWFIYLLISNIPQIIYIASAHTNWGFFFTCFTHQDHKIMKPQDEPKYGRSSRLPSLVHEKEHLQALLKRVGNGGQFYP